MLEHVFVSHLWFEDGWWGHEKKKLISYQFQFHQFASVIFDFKATVSELKL